MTTIWSLLWWISHSLDSLPVFVHLPDSRLPYDATDYPFLFELWRPLDMEKLEQGLREAKVPIRADKELLKASDPVKWRGHLQGVWQRRQKEYPEIRELYESKLIIAQSLAIFGGCAPKKKPLSGQLTGIRVLG